MESLGRGGGRGCGAGRGEGVNPGGVYDTIIIGGKYPARE